MHTFQSKYVIKCCTTIAPQRSKKRPPGKRISKPRDVIIEDEYLEVIQESPQNNSPKKGI